AYESRTPHVDWGPCIAVPLHGTHIDTAVIVAMRRAGAHPFDPTLAPLVTAFADQATAALDMAARQRLARQLDVYEDRDRIARDRAGGVAGDGGEGAAAGGRHSGGTHVTVALDVSDTVVVEVVDDGHGIDREAARSGLRNLRRRAQTRGGDATVAPLRDGGTR